MRTDAGQEVDKPQFLHFLRFLCADSFVEIVLCFRRMAKVVLLFVLAASLLGASNIALVAASETKNTLGPRWLVHGTRLYCGSIVNPPTMEVVKPSTFQ